MPRLGHDARCHSSEPKSILYGFKGHPLHGSQMARIAPMDLTMRFSARP